MTGFVKRPQIRYNTTVCIIEVCFSCNTTFTFVGKEEPRPSAPIVNFLRIYTRFFNRLYKHYA